jgi:tyrosine-protein kinase
VADTKEAEAVGLRDYLNVLRRRAVIVILVFVVVVAAAVTLSALQTPLYRGTATLLLQPRTSESLFNPNTGAAADPTRSVQTEIQVLKSGPVQDAVRKQLGSAPPVSAAPVGQTDVIAVTADSVSAKDAAAIANAYARSYIDFRRKQAVDDLFAAGNELQTKLTSLNAQLNAPGLSQSAKDVLVNQISLFKDRLDQVQVDAALKSGGAQLVTPATAPSAPFRPTPVRNGILGAIVGAILALGAAFLIEYLDDTIKGRDDLERAGSNLPVLGLIPSIADRKDSRKGDPAAYPEAGSAASEAYRALRTSIQFMGLDRDLKTLQITSPGQGEGKTTTLANLGAVLAKAGQRVLLVDCDLRRPRLHDYYGVSPAIGFTSVLLGDATLQSAVQHVAEDGSPLYLLPSGPVPPNPSELLWSKRAAQLLTAVRDQFDICLIDSPPLLPVTDAVVIARSVDAVVVVVCAGTTTRKQLQRAVEMLVQVGAPVEGVTFNRADGSERYGYHYGYSRGYGQPAGDASTGATSNGSHGARSRRAGKRSARR